MGALMEGTLEALEMIDLAGIQMLVGVKMEAVEWSLQHSE